MNTPIDFYFDFTSPYGYLMSLKIDALANRFGRKVRWYPILLGLVFKATGAQPLVDLPLKGPYVVRDFLRSARFLDVPYRHPERFPIPTQAAGRSYYWLHERDCALARNFAHACFRALFVENRDISAPETVIAIAAELGVDRQQLSAALATPEVKERLQQATEAAIARGVFGSPFVVIDDEPFFGVDRLPQIECWLEKGGF